MENQNDYKLWHKILASTLSFLSVGIYIYINGSYDYIQYVLVAIGSFGAWGLLHIIMALIKIFNNIRN